MGCVGWDAADVCWGGGGGVIQVLKQICATFALDPRSRYSKLITIYV